MFLIKWGIVVMMCAIVSIFARRWTRIRQLFFLSSFVVTMLLFAMWIVSFWARFGYSGDRTFVGYQAGALIVCPTHGEGNSGWIVGRRNVSETIWLTHLLGPIVVLGGWIPVVGCAIPALICWPDRHPKPGSCIKCRYDLTGNTSGICPECGTPIKSSSGSDVSVS